MNSPNNHLSLKDTAEKLKTSGKEYKVPLIKGEEILEDRI